LERLYAEHGRAVLAYAVRRCTDAHDAADIVAETFLVAWRRLDDVPADEGARLWLYAVARNVLSNHHRSERRRERLAERLRRELTLALDDLVEPGSGSGAVAAALASLGAEDREILRLTGWEGLTPRQIAVVLGITAVAARSRLHRARARFRAVLDGASEPDGAETLRLQEAR